MTFRRIICIGPRKGDPTRQCGKYLGDIEADAVATVNPPPCLACGIQWSAHNRGDGVIEMKQLQRNKAKEYNDETVYKEIE
jgi:hypothetical protein